MSKRKILSSSYYPAPTPAASYSAPDLNLDILLLPSHAVSAKKLRSSSEAAPSMDARVPDRDRPDDDEDDSPATSDSSSDVINTEEEPFPRNNTISAAAPPSAFLFDILRKEGRRIPEAPPPPCNIPTTHQLFPESSSAGGAVTELNLLAASAAESNQWLKLSEAAGTSAVGGGGEAAAVKPKKSRRGPRSRSSQYRGVTFYRRTGRWESHIWDCGKQVYLGGFDTAHAAARAYDRAAIRFRGVEADINFNLSDYDEDMKAMKDLSKEEFVHVLRRQSTGFSRGSSKYRGGVGVGLQKCDRWEARMGHLLANNNNGAGLLTNFLPRELDTSTTSAGGGVDDLDLRLGMSLNSPHHDGRKSSATARTPLMVDKTTTSSCVDGPSSSSSSSRAAGPFGFQALHGLPISTWTPPPPSSTFDHPEIRSSGSGQTRAVQGSNNINPFLATTGGGGGGFGNGNWAHHQHQLKGVPKWASQQIAASSGFLSSPNYDSNNSKRANAHISSTSSSSSSNNATAGGGSSSSTPNVNYPFQPNQYYNWYPHKRAQ